MEPSRRHLLAKEGASPRRTISQLCGFFLLSTAVLYISSVSKSLSPLQKLMQPLQSSAFKAITLQAAAPAPPSILEHVPASNQTGLSHSPTNATILKSELVRDDAQIGIDGVRLESGRDFQANVLNVSFACNFTLSPDGEACFSFQVEVQGPTNKCLFPYVRLRLTGAALVHVALQRTRALYPSEWEGCVMMPVPGIYYADANLIHCVLDPFKQNMTPESLKLEAGSPVRPDFGKPLTPYSFSVASFNRTLSPPSSTTMITTTAYSNYSWVFAPLCRNTLYRVARHCGKRKAGKFLSTKFQMNEWLPANAAVSFKKPRVRYRFDGYMWLPVNPQTGSIDYAAEHFGYQYTPPPSFLTTLDNNDNDNVGLTRKTNQTMLFVGSSHARYLMNQVSQIYYNLTYGLDGCTEAHTPPPDLSNNVSRFHLAQIHFAKQWTELKNRHEVADFAGGDYYDKYIVTLGHWDAGYPRKVPTPPVDFLQSLRSLIGAIDKFAKPTAEIFVTSVNQHPVAERMFMACDWRVPPMIDAYNDLIRSLVVVDQPIRNTRSFRFKDFNRTYFLDFTDIMDPIWDSAADFNHPCRYGTRPMALRVLDLLRE